MGVLRTLINTIEYKTQIHLLDSTGLLYSGSIVEPELEQFKDRNILSYKWLRSQNLYIVKLEDTKP